ncbi:thymidine phosphorylase family protein [Lysobacter sp. A6]|uniref:Putative thymidine phosphorylase n=1 Tax=Noviluteimonas lactosilytica TaxID=2888523 RepID=A0ABS8JM13_9GAMM|nr:thymidine phosphorylase family protein [Lysobacter lactosilyticus]MCC8364658.1 thymidine phosphorylase family protein [Lysobacter lactosilyticus]
MQSDSSTLRLVRAGIDTYQQPVVYMHRDCPVCRSEGFTALSRVAIRSAGKELVATLNVVIDDHLDVDVAALSEMAWHALAPSEGAVAEIRHAEPPASTSALRAKVFGQRLSADAMRALVQDTVDARLSDIELAAFVTACAGDRLDHVETIALTRAMVDAGQRIAWFGEAIVDKHSVGGLPGNRTTPLVVAIAAAAGLCIPKTSSRAITSPAGTADTMEVMAPVDLDLRAMQRVVDREGGCVVWGGSVRLSPADDILIRVERPLDLDSEGQLVASVLSKKIAAGATHVLIDLPVGPTAKVRSNTNAYAIEQRFRATASAFGLHLRIARTDGTQPVGRGIGPSLEARDVLQVLRGDAVAPGDLRDRSLLLAGALLDLAPPPGCASGIVHARALLDSGAAYRKFVAICEAQGGFTEPCISQLVHSVRVQRSGIVRAIDNRRLARVAKLAGAPRARRAGVFLRLRVGDHVTAGDVLFDLHAESRGEMDYARSFVDAHPDIFDIA